MTICEYNGCGKPATIKVALGGDNTPLPGVTPMCDECKTALWQQVQSRGQADIANFSVCPIDQRHPWEQEA